MFKGWIANLSDGSTRTQTPDIDGQPSAWQKLLAELRGNDDLEMTGLQLVHGDIKIHAKTGKDVDGYFHAYEQVLRNFYNSAVGRVTEYQGIGSIKDGVTFITWIDEEGKIFHEIRPLDSCKVHTTLYRE
jgi:hypothetical protein